MPRQAARTELLLIQQFIFDESSMIDQRNNQTYTTIKHKFGRQSSFIVLKLNYQQLC